MDFSKTFELDSEKQPGAHYVFRRLNVGKFAQLRLDMARASREVMPQIEAIQAEYAAKRAGVTEKKELDHLDLMERVYTNEVANQHALAQLAPIVIPAVLKAVMLDGKETRPIDWLNDPETSEDAIVEAYGWGLTGARMKAEDLGKWLSPGISLQPGTASATISDVSAALPIDSTSPAIVGDTSPTA